MTETPTTPVPRDRLVTLVGPSDHRDVTLVTEHGEIRLFEGRARVPAWLAAKLLRPGWHIRHTRP